VKNNLACYSAQLGRVEDVRVPLARAIELNPVFKELSLQDEDLAEIWKTLPRKNLLFHLQKA
jgi:hypothetical protein